MKKSLKKILFLFVVFALAFSLAVPAFGADGADLPTPLPGCSLQDTMKYLVVDSGARVATTANEAKAAAYIEQQFRAFGYTDVARTVFDRFEDSDPITAGKLVFKDGLPEIYGYAYPDEDFGKIEGQLVDFGTYPDFTAPTGVSGPIIAIVRFTEASMVEVTETYEWDGEEYEYTYYPLLLEHVESAIAAIQSNASFELNGILVSRDDGFGVGLRSEVPHYYLLSEIVADDEGTPGDPSVPCVSTTGYFLDKALEDRAQFDHMGWHYGATSVNAAATKPAPGGDPDLIIIVSSHMDSVFGSPGANDNATGTAAVVELAKRLHGVDLGNIEVRFVAFGSEEYGYYDGSGRYAESLTPAEHAIAINLNMDMIAPLIRINTGYFTDVPNDGEGLLNALSMDTWMGDYALDVELNLPGYLVVDDATNVNWNTDKTGIENVRIYNEGYSDHVSFFEAGIDAANMIFVRNEDDDIESGYHSSMDNLELNYCYDTHLASVALMENAILKAGRQEVSKRAVFHVDDASQTVTLSNADQLFKTWDVVEGTFSALAETAADIPFSFAPGQTTVSLSNPSAYEITDVVAIGAGTADNLDEERSAAYGTMTTALAVRVGDGGVTKANVALVLNGQEGTFTVIKADGHDWLKLRDVAAFLSDTEDEFAVAYDASARIIVVTSGETYAPIGNELTDTLTDNFQVSASTPHLALDGERVDLAAYHAGGHHYFRLSDLAALLGLEIEYNN